MNAAEQLISQARHGRFSELLPDLLEMATRSGGDRNEAWEAAAAAIQILFWQDRFAEAADLAEALIAQDGPLGGELRDQDLSFRTALLAGELHTGASVRPRLVTAAGYVPQGRNLGDDLLWLAEQLPERPVEVLLPSHFDSGGPAQPLDPAASGCCSPPMVGGGPTRSGTRFRMIRSCSRPCAWSRPTGYESTT